ncbi:carboxymuconolactone decarboxylase family protein [Aliikangiella coralliicola]|uniref:Carboxymuconolactone decarboxylase family protein n=1 Tax=Aliikangiella coralliicola TaxID=2592383 RepID=A0A545UAH7_9GAMM|nr:carboxymuconolactone decarboxylase family protein [Aliikangiella coralliicola]TQV86475.1 carboxymuconolactone decarboxylase family protein [Aliikangiella coralliicola]
MTTFTTHTIESAPEASKQNLRNAKSAYSFVPNLLGTMAEAPSLLDGYLALAGIFDKTSFSETERQIILMTNNRLNGCVYCMAAHTSISQMAGVKKDVIKALRNNTPIADAKLEALRQFAEVINKSRGWPTETQVSAFIDAGYTQQNVLEVILGTSLKVISNYTNHIAETTVDDAFAPNAWTPKSRDVA